MQTTDTSAPHLISDSDVIRLNELLRAQRQANSDEGAARQRIRDAQADESHYRNESRRIRQEIQLLLYPDIYNQPGLAES